MTPTAAQAEARRIVRESRRLADLRTRVDPNQPTPAWRLARDAALVEEITKVLVAESGPARVMIRFLTIVLIPALVWAAALALAAAVIISAMRFFQ